MAMSLCAILSTAGFLRAIVFHTPLPETVAVTASLALIVFSSICLGAILPLVLKKLGVDPAHSSTTIQVRTRRRRMKRKKAPGMATQQQLLPPPMAKVFGLVVQGSDQKEKGVETTDSMISIVLTMALVRSFVRSPSTNVNTDLLSCTKRIVGRDGYSWGFTDSGSQQHLARLFCWSIYPSQAFFSLSSARLDP